MGATGEPRLLRLSPVLWHTLGRVSQAENGELVLTFTPKELDMVLAGMKVDTPPGPDCLPVIFFKKS
jgi:hypothetical protein